MNETTKDRIDYLIWHIAEMLDSFGYEAQDYILEQLKFELNERNKFDKLKPKRIKELEGGVEK